MSQDLSDYVYLEAKERAFEIEIEARKLYEAKRKTYIDKERQSIQEKYNKMEETKSTNYKIARSTLINNSRNEILVATNKALLKLLNNTQLTIIKKIEDHAYYKELLKQLIIQGLIKLREPYVKVRCLQKDSVLVNEVLGEAELAYKQKMKNELNVDIELK